MTRQIEIIKAASEIGAGKSGAGNGPDRLLHTLQNEWPAAVQFPVFAVNHFNNRIPPQSQYRFAKRIDILEPAMENLAEAVEHSMASNHFPVILSGDHSNAIGSISGFKNCIGNDEIGVIWIDAHFDLHSPFTTPSGNIHGMALNALLADDNRESGHNEPDSDTLYFWEKLKHLGSKDITPKVSPENVVFIGVRDFETEEKQLAEKLGLKVFAMDEVREIGIEAVLDQTLEQLSRCKCIYVSFDVDSLDTSISKATGTPVDGGLFLGEAEAIFKRLFHHPKVAAFEITEINPDLEEGNRMAESVVHCLKTVL